MGERPAAHSPAPRFSMLSLPQLGSLPPLRADFPAHRGYLLQAPTAACSPCLWFRPQLGARSSSPASPPRGPFSSLLSQAAPPLSLVTVPRVLDSLTLAPGQARTHGGSLACAQILSVPARRPSLCPPMESPCQAASAPCARAQPARHGRRAHCSLELTVPSLCFFRGCASWSSPSRRFSSLVTPHGRRVRPHREQAPGAWPLFIALADRTPSSLCV
ncbi:hypothetical protein ZEAMMB73_Zm00001d030717 [Zea mays]|uniref:Uncharacterized protein n=1 Tax=Zea mays TaxID=4577 RepID=A0A1D6KE20_MAIZE|nr:hypothetical protein ZEAMMB73_Zm00001d030717 [Zea mays]